MSDPVEVVARALCVFDESDPDAVHEWGWPREALPTWTIYTHEARAAVRALEEAGMVIVPREATEAMVKAAHRDTIGDPRPVWRAMLDAAGGEGGENV